MIEKATESENRWFLNQYHLDWIGYLVPKISMTARRSGAKQAISLFVTAFPLHVLPVTGLALPRPCVMMLSPSIFCETRYALTAEARLSESVWLYLSEPIRSV